MMFVDCVVVWAAAVNFGQFVDAAAAVVWSAAAVSADVFVLAVAAVVLAAVIVWDAVLAAVVECPAAAASAADITGKWCCGCMLCCGAWPWICC